MNTKLLTLICAVAFAFGNITPGRVSENQDSLMVVGDVVVVRPVCLAVTVFGAAFFVVSLLVAAVAKSVHETADTLLAKPGKATFTRRLGDMEALGY